MGISIDGDKGPREVYVIPGTCWELQLDCGDVGEDGTELITPEYLAPSFYELRRSKRVHTHRVVVANVGYYFSRGQDNQACGDDDAKYHYATYLIDQGMSDFDRYVWGIRTEHPFPVFPGVFLDVGQSDDQAAGGEYAERVIHRLGVDFPAKSSVAYDGAADIGRDQENDNKVA